MSAGPELHICDNGQELATEAADLCIWLGKQAIHERGRFRVALAGGSTPRSLYNVLAQPGSAKQLDWSKAELFFGDERCVPPDHPDSNFRMADETLLRPLGIGQGRIFRMQGETADPEQAARDYDATLRRQFGVTPPARPSFDLILLGLGEDGHTASLFPGTNALQEKAGLVATSRSPQGIAQRLTLTIPIVNQARTVVFLVSGGSKASVVRQVLEGPQPGGLFPAQLIRPEQGRLIWLLDRAAAAELTVSKQQLASHEE